MDANKNNGKRQEKQRGLESQRTKELPKVKGTQKTQGVQRVQGAQRTTRTQKASSAPKTPEEKLRYERRQAELKRVKRNRRVFRIVIFVLIASTIMFSLSMTVFFKIKTVEVVFDGGVIYKEEQIRGASGITPDTVNFFMCDSNAVSEKICKELSYIKTAEVSKKFPYTLVVTVSPALPDAAAKTSLGYAIIDKDGKVLEEVKTTDGLTIVQFPKGAEFEKGSAVSLKTAADAKNKSDKSIAELYSGLRKQIKAAGLTEITKMDLRDTDNLKITYQDRIMLRIGANVYIEDKLRLAQSSIEDLDKNNPQAKGELNLSVHRDANFLESTE